jgi:hypothetical protein
MPLNTQKDPRSRLDSVFPLSALSACLRANGLVQRIGNAVVWSLSLRVIVVGALLFSAYIAFRYIQQPLMVKKIQRSME